MKNSSALAGVGATLFVVACSVGSPGNGTFASDQTNTLGGAEDTGGSEGVGSSGEGDSTEATSGTPPVTGPPTSTTDDGVRCGKIDLLVAVEAPGGPEGYWGYENWYSKLLTGFGVLVSELYVTIEVEDFRVMLVPGTPRPFDYVCEDPTGAECVEPTFDLCDETVGAGFNGSEIPEWSTTECMPGRYFESGEANVESTFACVLFHEYDGAQDVQPSGGDDTLMSALGQALSGAGEVQECNSGFLRDDALLVVVLLSPDADPRLESSTGNPPAWKDALVQAKGGSEENIVVLTLGPDSDQPGALCPDAQTPGWPSQLRDFTESFSNSSWNSVCLPSYDPFFTQAAEVIDQACEDFRPVG